MLGAIVAPNITVLIIARVIQRFGGAVFPIAFGIIRDELPRERVSWAIGLTSSVVTVGGGLGTVLAGPIVAGSGWSWLFWIPMIAVALAVVTCRLFGPSPRDAAADGSTVPAPTADRLAGRAMWMRPPRQIHYPGCHVRSRCADLPAGARLALPAANPVGIPAGVTLQATVT